MLFRIERYCNKHKGTLIKSSKLNSTLFSQVLLLKWILLVFNVIDDLTPLHSLYGVILNYVIVDDLVSRWLSSCRYYVYSTNCVGNSDIYFANYTVFT